MLKKALIYSVLMVALASCASLKTAFTGKQSSENEPVIVSEKKELKFLNEAPTPGEPTLVSQEKKIQEPAEKATPNTSFEDHYFSKSTLEQTSPLQIKYSILLNTPAQELSNTAMFEFIDEWYGTKYKLGGTTKKGIDCSAFSQYLFADVYGITIPRTAREQYKMTDRISRTELREGDLIFFNTRGGVSHVGVYLQNNKFVHSAGSGGVMFSDIFDEYWVRRFIAVGRLKEQPAMASGN